MTERIPTTEDVREAYSEMSGWDISADEADAAFDSWLAGVIAEKRAEWEAEQGEVEWEYGTRCPMPECTEPHLLDENDGSRQPEESLWRRTKARDVPTGPWMPVNENGETP